MTLNDLDLNDRKMLLEARKSGSDGTFQPFRRQKQEGEKAEWKGENEEFLDIFCQDSSKKARKLG